VIDGGYLQSTTSKNLFILLLLLPLVVGCGKDAIDSIHVPGCDGGCGQAGCNADGGSWPAEFAALEDEVLTRVNDIRHAGASCANDRFGPVPALSMNAALRQSARCHSLDMATQNYFTHESKDGRSPWTRMTNAGYHGFPAAENIAAGYGDARSVMNGWMASPGHCRNIMLSTATEIGIGFAFSSQSDYRTYWTQDFGRR
jgi:uncharacterized protein YkwD